jgi:predicted metal-binding membrane protein
MRSSPPSGCPRTESSAPELTSQILRHQRLIVAGSLAAVAALAWIFVLRGAGLPAMGGMAGMAPPPFAALVLMWWAMMVAMMLPSAAPAILLYGRVRAMRGGDAAIAQSWLFAAGYLLAWLLFSLAAAALQQRVAGPAMALADHRAEAALLIAAGLYQLSPLKGACLVQCRSPAQFISRHWRPGWSGAVRLGLLHGAYCVGCCWLLMALLFVGGVMNMLWIVVLTLIVAVEKLFPRGDWFARAAGVGLIAGGAARLLV